jgi:hypothetical protein
MKKNTFRMFWGDSCCKKLIFQAGLLMKLQVFYQEFLNLGMGFK